MRQSSALRTGIDIPVQNNAVKEKGKEAPFNGGGRGESRLSVEQGHKCVMSTSHKPCTHPGGVRKSSQSSIWRAEHPRDSSKDKDPEANT